MGAAIGVFRGGDRDFGKSRSGWVDANLATAVRTTVVPGFTWLLAVATRQPEMFQGFSGKTWLFLVLSGMATGLSWLCYSMRCRWGQPRA
jgi:bacterial/archaeal transporter family protein